jgi:hypothetical protein
MQRHPDSSQCQSWRKWLSLARGYQGGILYLKLPGTCQGLSGYQGGILYTHREDLKLAHVRACLVTRVGSYTLTEDLKLANVRACLVTRVGPYTYDLSQDLIWHMSGCVSMVTRVRPYTADLTRGLIWHILGLFKLPTEGYYKLEGHVFLIYTHRNIFVCVDVIYLKSSKDLE